MTEEPAAETTIRVLVRLMPIGIATLLIYALHFWGSTSWVVFGSGLAIATAAMLVGGLLGFLFGLPRAPSDKRIESEPSTDGEETETLASERSVYQASSNLEDVSDWLTKILVGVGLTQIAEIADGLGEFGWFVAPALGGGSIGATIGIALLLSYLPLGFLFAFIWTVRYLPALFERGRAAAKTVANELANKLAEASHAARVDPEKTQQVEKDVTYTRFVLAELTPDRRSARNLIRSLVREYEHIRKRMVPGPERTFQMDRLIERARSAAMNSQYDAADIKRLYEKGRPGSRVIGIALVQALPSRDLYRIVLQSIEHPRSAFEQYHGLRALYALIPELDPTEKQKACTAIDRNKWITAANRDRWRLAQHLKKKLDCVGPVE